MKSIVQMIVLVTLKADLEGEASPFTTMNTVLNQWFICTATIGKSLQSAFIELYFSSLSA